MQAPERASMESKHENRGAGAVRTRGNASEREMPMPAAAEDAEAAEPRVVAPLGPGQPGAAVAILQTGDVPALVGQAATMDHVEDAWLRSGVPTTWLKHQWKQEACIEYMTAQAHRMLEPEIRDAALRCLLQILRLSTWSQSGWCKAALLLDRYCAKVGVNPQLLPMICVALVKIVSKFEGTAGRGITQECWRPCAEWLGAWLVSAGYDVPEATQELVFKQEIAVLQALKWDLPDPCAQQWSLIFMTRFALLAGPSLQGLQRMEQKLLCLASIVIRHHQQSSPMLSHGMLALGLLCLCMVEAGLLPLEELKPDDVSAEEWRDLYLESWPSGRAPRCSLTATQWAWAFGMLMLSTGLRKAELQTSARHASAVLGEAVRRVRQAQ
eukprot:TRINITY_DN43030_c0_g1_i1.p1 TRINITY_DN43030_c0_g1~~TRINITY_DN43030_c0_g1_i1.p1  ORF type:complete len:383 (+),score=82.48 TRINITY_DN43030_c0_g1_i1:98-1246(+)